MKICGYRMEITGAVVLGLLVWATAFGQDDRLPRPTGKYSVGRTSFDWTDNSRVDLENANGHREIVVWVWYPASVQVGAQQAEWLPPIWSDIFGASPELAPPRTSADQPPPQRYPINTIKSHSYTNPPVSSAQNKYPVLVFAPGYGSSPMEYSILMEDLASHGYIVAGIVPTYFSSFTVFADGRVAGQHLMAREIPGFPRSSWERPGPVSEPVYRLWTGDIRFALDQLEKLNASNDSQFRGRLDFDRVGALGHSIGATATAQVAKDDPRVRAAVLIEGTIMGEVSHSPLLPKPLLVMLASSAKGRERASLPNFGTTDEMVALVRGAKPPYVVIIAETSHPFPSDIALMPFAKDWRHDPNPARALEATRAYIQAFFEKHLLGERNSLLDRSSPEYPYVTLRNNLEQVAKPVEKTSETASAAPGADISGTWACSIDRPTANGGPIDVTFIFKQEDGKLSGTYSGFGPFGEEKIIGTVHGNKVAFGWDFKGPDDRVVFAVAFTGSIESMTRMTGTIGSPFCGNGCKWTMIRK